MSYIVIGLFPNQVEVDKVLSKLENAGYYDYYISNSFQDTPEMTSVDKKNSFWKWFFNSIYPEIDHLRFSDIDHNMITVNLKSRHDAILAKAILESSNAIQVEQKKNYMTEKYSDSDQELLISEMVKARIISKAKNNLFFTNDRKPHLIHQKRIADEIDGLGYKI